MARYQIRFPIVTGAQMRYEFGPFQLNPSAQELLGDGGVLPLAQPSFQMLVHLVQRHGDPRFAR
jgi:DNA-binding winged helix-turn-helix (wHTH) protein